MRILIENNVTEIVSGNLTSFLTTEALHKAENMLNEYPTVQWISGFPDDVRFNTQTGRKEVECYFTATGLGSMNGIYLGNFSGDQLTYKVEELTNVQTMSYQDLTTSSGDLWVDVPVRIFNSFGHFVRGVPASYDDYLYTLEDLGYSTHYAQSGFRITVKIMSDEDVLKGLGNVEFKVNQVMKVDYTDNSVTPNRGIWKFKGNFTDGTNIISKTSPYFSRELTVGMPVTVNMPSVGGAVALDRIAQVLEIRGNGEKESSVVLLIRDYDNEDGSGGSVEPSIDSMINGASKWVDVHTLGDYFDVSSLNHSLGVNYIHSSLRVGLFRAGYIEQFPNPQVGMTKTYKDYSKKTETLDGGHHAVNRNIAKIFNGKLILDRDRVRRFLTFAEHQRAKPFPVQIISDMVEETPSVFYGFFSSTPSENLSYRTGVLRDVDFSIQQVF